MKLARTLQSNQENFIVIDNKGMTITSDMYGNTRWISSTRATEKIPIQ